MQVVIGCPVYNREWVLDRWFDCVYRCGIPTDDVTLVFGYTEGEDNTREVIKSHEDRFDDVLLVDCNDLPAYGGREIPRYHTLSEARNRILSVVRDLEPDFYFSWDTDIMLAENYGVKLIELDKPVVAPWVDLVPPGGIPNCITRIPNTNSFRRFKPYKEHYPQSGVYPVDICFAVVMMKPEVYAIDYKWHQGGEDYGWGLNLIEAGIQCWMAGDLHLTNHIYTKDKK